MLKGEAKRDYMREYMRRRRKPATKPPSKLRKPRRAPEANDFIRALLDFTVDYSNWVMNWQGVLASEDKTALMRTIYQCSDQIAQLAQKLDGR